MKKFIFILVVMVVAGFTFASQALAGHIAERQARQQRRIQQGIHSGELTHNEIRALSREQHRIRRIHKKAWQDGRLSRQERRRLEHRLDQASNHIHRLKHNWHHRYWRGRSDGFGSHLFGHSCGSRHRGSWHVGDHWAAPEY